MFSQVLPLVWLLANLAVAMQHLHSGGRFATYARWLALISAYLLIMRTATVLLELIGILGGA